jgi:RNA polymerase sigma factor (TIGR02999 family)
MSRPDVTTLLRAWSEGDLSARDALMPVVYKALRRRAGAYLRRERRDHPLQPTALVHEVYLRLVDQTRAAWVSRTQFFGVASQMMRRILVDHARARQMAKRSGQWTCVPLDEDVAAFTGHDIDLLDLDRALTRLAEVDPRKCQVAEMRFFGGLSLEETAGVLDISVATVERDWQAARAWLYQALRSRPSR